MTLAKYPMSWIILIIRLRVSGNISGNDKIPRNIFQPGDIKDFPFYIKPFSAIDSAGSAFFTWTS